MMRFVTAPAPRRTMVPLRYYRWLAGRSYPKPLRYLALFVEVRRQMAIPPMPDGFLQQLVTR